MRKSSDDSDKGDFRQIGFFIIQITDFDQGSDILYGSNILYQIRRESSNLDHREVRSSENLPLLMRQRASLIQITLECGPPIPPMLNVTSGVPSFAQSVFSTSTEERT